MTSIKPKLALLVACFGLGVLPALSSADDQACFYNESLCNTGQRSAALKKCDKKHGTAKKRCRKKARKLPV